MGHPWNGPRHRSWASDTIIAGIALAVLLAATIATDQNGEPPTYLVGLLGTAAGAFFSALGADKNRRDREVASTAGRAERTAGRAEAKADALAEVAREEHPEVTDRLDHLGEEDRDP